MSGFFRIRHMKLVDKASEILYYIANKKGNGLDCQHVNLASNPHKMNITRIIVFGLGAAGSNFLINMIHAHPTMLFSGVDFDFVEARNYEAGTQPYTKADLNRPKVQAMQRIISASRKVMSGHVIKIGSTAQIEDIAGDPKNALLVDAFDNIEARNYFLPLKGKYHILHIGFSPSLTGEAVWAESYSEMTANGKSEFDVCQANIARPFIHGLTAISALIATEFIDTGAKKNVYFDSKLKMFTF